MHGMPVCVFLHAGNNVVKDASPCISDACALGFGGGAVFMTGTGIGRLFVQSCIFENNVGQVKAIYA